MNCRARGPWIVAGCGLAIAALAAPGCGVILRLDDLEVGDAGTDGAADAPRVDASTDHRATTRDAASDSRGLDASVDSPRDAASPRCPRRDAGDVGGPSLYRATIMADCPVGYWRLGDLPTAAQAKDETGQNPGTYVGGVSVGYSPGAIVGDDAATATSFNGNGTIVIGSVLSFAGLAPYSLEGWARLAPSDAGQGCYAAILGRTRMGTCGPRDGYFLFNNCSDDGGFEPAAAREPTYCDGGQAVVSVPPSPAGAWDHLVETWDGSQLRLYVSGHLVSGFAYGSTTALAPDGGSQLEIGGSGGGPSWFGALQEVAIYDYALSVTQVCSHHSVGIGNPPCQ